ncbi:hypothetical protein IFM89_031635 [Coptis chinensis]|uniref:Protein kinase domain-containing protein n=1 Tax=Coptis chinensis TaxID=261450 RepID=A0A835LJ98_9MAGN|nr:hypothetical protein IFM89_031635 [Coptis chinensis]
MDQYEKINLLDAGCFGTVFKVKKKGTEEFLAMKEILVSKSDAENGIQVTTLREIALLRMLSDGPNIVRLKDTLKTINKRGETIYCLFFEYMEMNLREYNEMHGGDLAVVKKLMFELCKGVAFLHGRAVMHRDLKPQNILINPKSWELKIADFGLSRQFNIPTEVYSLDVCTRPYRAPELLLNIEEYTIAADMWSVGCIFAELVQEGVLFEGSSVSDQLQEIYKLLGTPTEEEIPGISIHIETPSDTITAQDLSSTFPQLEASGVDLLFQMLQYDHSKRISAKAALEHPYFTDLGNIGK